MLKQKQILNCLLRGNTSLGNAYELAHILQSFNFDSGDILASFDVSSLFTRVPVDDLLKIVELRLSELRELENCPLLEITSLTNFGIVKLLHHVVCECFFSWDGLLYKQRSGLPMGGRLSPILANLYMEHLEYRILCTSLIIPKLFFHYVDDIIIIWNKKNGTYTEFLASLNSFHSDISLTDELEENRTLAFLDLLIKRPLISDQGEILQKLELLVFRKPTHCDRYIPFKLAHQMDLKRNLFCTLLLRAFRLLQNFLHQLEGEL